MLYFCLARSVVMSKVGPDDDFAGAIKDVASLVYLCKQEEGCLPDQVWENTSPKK